MIAMKAKYVRMVNNFIGLSDYICVYIFMGPLHCECSLHENAHYFIPVKLLVCLSSVHESLCTQGINIWRSQKSMNTHAVCLAANTLEEYC